jgi:tetratricopeptide (TPR) repeat protein
MKRIAAVAVLFSMALAAWAQEKPDALKAWQEKRFDDSITICLNEIKETPNNRNSYVVLGWSLRDSGRYAEAFDYAKLGIDRTGYSTQLAATAEVSLNWYLNQGRIDEAAAKLVQFIGVLPSDAANLPSAYAMLGTIYLKKGSFIYADTALSFALHANATVFEWWANAGMARENYGDYKGALKAYDEALKLNPSDSEALRGRDRVRQKLPPSP